MHALHACTGETAALDAKPAKVGAGSICEARNEVKEVKSRSIKPGRCCRRRQVVLHLADMVIGEFAAGPQA